MIEVWYGGKREMRDPLYGLPLTPGLNEVDDDVARLLLLRGVVSEVEESRPSSRREE